MTALDSVYSDEFGRRKIGIYAHVFDRFILIDDRDFSMVLETARILSSKVATTVYILPSDIDLNNGNCIYYSIYDKLSAVKIIGTDVIAGQTPVLRILNGSENIRWAGIPPDFVDVSNKRKMFGLLEYAAFVNRMNYIFTLADDMYNEFNLKRHVQEFSALDSVKKLSAYNDQTHFPDGMKTEIKRILYNASGIEEARILIGSVLVNVRKQVPGFMTIINQLSEDEYGFIG